jgi:uncharacterized membrane protein
MFKRITNAIYPNRHRLFIFAALSASTVFCALLLRFRMQYSDSTHYAFLIWNLFLAWIPFGIAYVTHSIVFHRRALLALIPINIFLWIIFFPNAPYILTDLQTITYWASEFPVWYDVIMLIWFAWTGLLLGIMSLYFMQETVRWEYGSRMGWLFVLVITVLSSIGMYLGRFIRLNSWDILFNPLGVASGIVNSAMDSSLRAIGFISSYTIFFLYTYVMFYAFGHLLPGRSQRK